jgi:hypothetical protein
MNELESFQTDREASESAAWNGLPSLESPFSELEEMELASELLDVTNETELEHVLDGLLRKAATAAGGSLNSSTGRALGGLLKGTIKKALPTLGRAVGDYYAPGLGIGSGVASNAGRILGLELEGLSGEDQEFEVAKGIVRMAGAAVGNAATAPQTLPPAVAAKQAVTQATRTHAPGMLKPIPKRRQTGCACHSAAGRWERRGPEIILDGL